MTKKKNPPRELKITDTEVMELRHAHKRGARLTDLAFVYGISIPYVNDIVKNFRRLR